MPVIYDTVLIALLYVTSALIVWQFVGYPLFMAFMSRFLKTAAKDHSYQPFISVLVATYNEEAMIRGRLENLLNLSYPDTKYEILVVDSASTDATRQIVKSVMREHSKVSPMITLVEEGKRNGKSSALNLGVTRARGGIVLVADANSLFSKDVLRELAPHFKNPYVGAVSGRYMVLNPEEDIPQQEDFYWRLEDMMFRAESDLDSVSTVIGTISAWRKELLDFSPEMITEDLDMTINVRRMGYKISYEPDAIAYENAATTVDDQILQRKRTGLGTLQATIRHIRYFIPPKNLYSAVIFPSHKILVMLSPFLLILIPFLYIIIAKPLVILGHIISVGLLSVTLFGILLTLRLQPIGENSQKFSIRSLPKLVHYVLLNEYIILLAWRDLIAGNHSVLWEKADSTRVEV